MILDNFLDRTAELQRLTSALTREERQFLVIYGRRRIGKSTLIKEVLRQQEQAVYFLADRTNEVNQRRLFSTVASNVIPDFDKASYGDWESLLRALSRQADKRLTVCLDEFPYLVKSCPSLPSIIQKLLNERTLSFDLIICGSSQQLMQGYVLDKKEPLYGLANEIMRIHPIPARYVSQALKCDAKEAVTEYAVWGWCASLLGIAQQLSHAYGCYCCTDARQKWLPLWKNHKDCCVMICATAYRRKQFFLS